MRHVLQLHGDFRCQAVAAIDIDVSRPRPGVLALRYQVTGNLAALRIPAPAAPARTDELWRHTCFEAFVRPAADGPYYEFNLAPSTQWAAYRFEGYRAGMTDVAAFASPGIAMSPTADGFELAATLDLGALADLPPSAPWRLALSAVIEQADGAVSYWAYAHPHGKPDFHHPDSFALDLAGAQ
jgi:hypothetical protein